MSPIADHELAAYVLGDAPPELRARVKAAAAADEDFAAELAALAALGDPGALPEGVRPYPGLTGRRTRRSALRHTERHRWSQVAPSVPPGRMKFLRGGSPARSLSVILSILTVWSWVIRGTLRAEPNSDAASAPAMKSIFCTDLSEETSSLS